MFHSIFVAFHQLGIYTYNGQVAGHLFFDNNLFFLKLVR